MGMRNLNEVAELRARVRAMRLAFRHLPGILVGLYDLKGMCVLMEGSPSDDVIGTEGKHYDSFVPPERRESFLRLFTRACQGESTKEDYPVGRHGVILEAIAVPVRDEKDAVLFILIYCRDITAERAARVALAAEGGRDTLTGLAKRSVLVAHVNVLIKKNCAFAVLFIDLDRFKRVNDTLGHKTGDLVLSKVARALILAIRTGDLAVRVGGDEFVVVLADAATPEEVASRILARLVKVTAPFGAGASMGMATYPGDGGTLEELLTAADAAMYQAKRRGSGRIETLKLPRFKDPSDPEE